MICPYCDSLIRDMPDNNVCPQCGAPLGIYRDTGNGSRAKGHALKFPDPPIGVYKDVAGYLEIGKDSVTFSRRPWFKEHKRTIPFSEIFAVAYEAGKPFNSGFLCVREWQDRKLPVPVIAYEVVEDETSVYFKMSDNEKFWHVYNFLKQCADINNAANKDWRRIAEGTVFGKYEGFYGYMELGHDAVTVYKKLLLSAPTVRKIPYDEIGEVAFHEAKGSTRGGLSIRAREDRKELKIALREALVDDTSIDFTISGNEQMYQVYLYLMEHVRENTTRWLQNGV